MTTTWYGYPLPQQACGIRDELRPWWALRGDVGLTGGWLREDGLCLEVLYTHDEGGPEALISWMWADKPDETEYVAESVADGLAFADRAYPRPAPPPLPGQVWLHDGQYVTQDTGQFKAEWFEQPKGILVYGPFAPWAPPDWDASQS